MKCPCCNGTGEIERDPPVDLTPLQFRIWDVVRKARDGIGVDAIADRCYSGSDGGPLYANRSINVLVHRMNKRLHRAHQRIKSSGQGPGAVYRLERL